MADSRFEEIHCGNVRRGSVKTCAGRVLDGLQDLHSVMRRNAAVCVAPCGDVTIEDPELACEGDIVVVVDTKQPLFALYRMVRDEISGEINSRGWRTREGNLREG